MTHEAPGKHHREGITLVQLFDMFPTDEAAEQWFINQRWPEGVECPHCGSTSIKRNGGHPSMPFHCKDCRQFFSTKTGSVTDDPGISTKYTFTEISQ